METEICVLKKEDLVDLLEKFNQKLISQLPAIKRSGNDVDCNPKVRRLNTRQIKEMLGIGDTTFEKVQDSLPLHRTKSGRMFAYEHDLIVHLFREHPPYFDFSRFNDYIKEENLVLRGRRKRKIHLRGEICCLSQ